MPTIIKGDRARDEISVEQVETNPQLRVCATQRCALDSAGTLIDPNVPFGVPRALNVAEKFFKEQRLSRPIAAKTASGGMPAARIMLLAREFSGHCDSRHIYSQ